MTKHYLHLLPSDMNRVLDVARKIENLEQKYRSAKNVKLKDIAVSRAKNSKISQFKLTKSQKCRSL